jgi:hypothetical protein
MSSRPSDDESRSTRHYYPSNHCLIPLSNGN